MIKRFLAIPSILRNAIDYLVQKIGARPAGSGAERLAQDYIAMQLTGWGYKVQRLPASFAPLPHFFFPYVFGSLVLVLVVGGYRAFPGSPSGYPW